MPPDLSSGEAVFAWTWVNREQEFNMNCAAVMISNDNSGGNGTYPTVVKKSISMPSSKDSVEFRERPAMFIADVGNGCVTPKTDAELKFPDPGIDVEEGDGEYPLRLPVGNCSAPI